MSESSKWTTIGQCLAAGLVIIGGLAVIPSLPNPAWEVDSQAQATMDLAVGLESKWEPSHVNRLSASDVEGWGLSPKGWRRSGNGWSVGPNEEHFEVGTWKEATGKSGFALIFTEIDHDRCMEMSRLLGEAFDEFAVNDKGQDCAAERNKLVFYRNPSA